MISASGHGMVGLRDLGHLGVDGLGELQLHAQPLAAPALVAAVEGLEPGDRLIGRERVLLPLRQGDDVEIADIPLELAEARVVVLQQLLVEADGRAELALLLVTLGLPHLGGQAGPLLAVVLVEALELLERLVQIVVRSAESAA